MKSTVRPPGTGPEEYELHRAKALSLLERRFPRFSADERLELYHTVWLTVLEKRRRGQGDRIENLEAYLLGGVEKLAFKLVTRADARRRVTVDPLARELTALADHQASPEEHALLEDEARSARALLDELGARERAVAKLRFGVGLEPEEVQARLGIGARQYRRLIERTSRTVAERAASLEQGGRSKRQVSLLQACLSGIATQRQRERARALLDADPKARALFRAMRRAAEGTSAAIPLTELPAVTERRSSRVLQTLAGARQSVGDLAESARQHAASALVRAGDPTPISGARPGTVAAALAGCLAMGGGTYCAVEGLPDPVRSTFVGRPEARPEPPSPDRKPPLGPPQVESEAPASQDGATDVPPPPPDPAQVEPREPEPAPTEFFEASEAESGGSDATAASQAPAPSSGDGPGEFGP